MNLFMLQLPPTWCEACSFSINNRKNIGMHFTKKFGFFLTQTYRTSIQLNRRKTTTAILTKQTLESLLLSQYKHGKFHSLLSNVVASPSLLLTACHNLTTIDSLSPHLSIQHLSSQLSNNSFDVQSSSSSLSQSLILPNLKLKVVIEAIRLVLQAIYDSRFVTFSYGGRVDLGRHTAIRYLKNVVESPTWWFTVKFDGELLFDDKCVDRLCLVLGDKIIDDAFIALIRSLFRAGVLRVELGGVGLGRGLPQECGLCSILINVYFDWFDKEIQKIRLETNKMNPKFEESEGVLYKPLKIYCLRYLDEILVIVSGGTKTLTLELKNRVVEYLEGELGLKVDRVKTVIHSPVSEKMEFLGMEIQAVAPSVLRRTKTDKAIRAHKKYLRQKEVKLLELKNTKERNRKKLGIKLLKHVFKKLKQSNNGFKFDFQIENEVKQVFSTWGDEVVQAYLKSVDERWEWHHKLTGGDFLSLGRIRDQLPSELIRAYDNFQEQVDKHLNPVRAKRALENEVRWKEEEYEKSYAERTIEDLTRRCIKVEAPLELIKEAVKMVGFTNKMGRPRPISLLTVLEDADIIKWYAGVARRWLDFYCCCHNFRKVKIIVSYHLRFSCLLTLAEKHEATKEETIRHFTKDLKVFDAQGGEEINFPSEKEIKMMGDKNLCDPNHVDGALTMVLTRLATDEPLRRCIAHFCDRTDTNVYRIRLLQKHLNVNPLGRENWIHYMGWIHDSLHRKCMPLCSAHISELYMGRLNLQDIDCTSLIDFD